MPDKVISIAELEKQIKTGFNGGVPKVTDQFQAPPPPSGQTTSVTGSAGPSVLETPTEKLTRETKAILGTVGDYFKTASQQAWGGFEDLARAATGMQPLNDAEQGSTPAKLAAGAHKLIAGNAKALAPLVVPELIAAPGATALALGAGAAGATAGAAVGSQFDAPGSSAFADIGGDIAGFGLGLKTANALHRAQNPFSTKLLPGDDGVYRPQSTSARFVNEFFKNDPYPASTPTAFDTIPNGELSLEQTLARSADRLGMARNSRTTPPLPYSRAALQGAILGGPRQLPAAGESTLSKFDVPSPRVTALGYAQAHGFDPRRIEKQGELNVETSKAIAKAYDLLPAHANTPEARAAYSQLSAEIEQQWDHALTSGYQMEPWTKPGQPYKNSKEMADDVNENKHLYFFQGGEEHPALGQKDAQGLSLNDKFRAIHDLFGHAVGRFSFGAKGEEAAWRTHSGMFSPDARRAMTTETRGQNSWVNFGPNSNLPVADRPFAEQKFALLPDQYVFPSQGPFNLPARSESSRMQWTPERGTLGRLMEPLGKLDTGPGRPFFARPDELPVTQSKEGFSALNPETGNQNTIRLGSPDPTKQRPAATNIAPGWEDKLARVGISPGEVQVGRDLTELMHVGRHGELVLNPDTAARQTLLHDYGASVVGSNWTKNPRLLGLFNGLVEGNPEAAASRALAALSPQVPVETNLSDMVLFAARLKEMGKTPADLTSADWKNLMKGIGNPSSKAPNLKRALAGEEINSYTGDTFSSTGKVTHFGEGVLKGREAQGIPFDIWLNRALGLNTDQQPTSGIGYESIYRPYAAHAKSEGSNPFSYMANVWSAMRDIHGEPSAIAPESMLEHAGISKLPEGKAALRSLMRDLQFGGLITQIPVRLRNEQGMKLLFGGGMK